MARQNIEEILEKKVAKLKEEENAKKAELTEIQKSFVDTKLRSSQ